MTKFDPTEIDISLEKIWNTPIMSKWQDFAIESPTIVSWEETDELICRFDKFLSGWRYGGNDDDYNKIIWDFAGVPDDNVGFIYEDKYIPDISRNPIKSILNIEDEKEANKKVEEIITKQGELIFQEIEKWQKKWNRFDIDVDNKLFQCNLFSCNMIEGPYSFVNFKTGKIGLLGTASVSSDDTWEVFRPEIEKFAKEYPDIDIYISALNPIHVEFTIRLFEGKITVVKTRTKEDLQYLEYINHLNGSYSAKRGCPFRIIGRFFKKIYFKILKSDFVKKHFPGWYEEFIIQRNYNFDYSNEHYFDIPHAKYVIDSYREYLETKNDKEV